MEVKIDRRFDLPVAVEQAWELLRDVRATAACMPGAQVTEQLDERHFKGLVRSRIGPATMSFTGQLEVIELDAQTRTLRLHGKGSDTNGSAAAMDLVARVEPGSSPAGSVLVGATTVTVSGKLSQFGGRFLLPVAESMLSSFVARFSEQAATMHVDTAAAAPVPLVHVEAPEPLNLAALAWAALRRWWSGLFGVRR